MSRPKKEAVATAVAIPVNAPVIKKSLQIPGLFDILTDTQNFYDVILKKFQQQSHVYGFKRLETPPIEDSQLYRMFYGQSDPRLMNLVEFESQGKKLSMRPELLPSVLRAYAQHKMYEQELASKWMYFGSTMSLGPKNQFVSDYHLGVEVFGTFSHLTEAQTISCMWHLLKGLGLEDLTLEVNHIGESHCQRNYEEALSSYFSGKKYDLCDNCIEHLHTRTMNVLRCSNLDCQTVASDAPTILDFLEEPSRKHFTNILEALDEVEIPYQLNPLYVGADGMGKTNCKISYQSKETSDKVVITEGGYHDNLMQRLSGKNWCAFGMQSTISKIAKAMELSMLSMGHEQENEVYLVPLGELASKKSLRLFRDLTEAKVSVFDQFGDTGVKNQLRLAVESKTPIALIMGQKEALDEMVILRDVKSGMQEMFSYDKIINEVKKRLGK